LEGRRIQAACPNENGDVEQRHYRFKKTVEQALILRGSSDFADREAYGLFLRKLLRQLNAGRQGRLGEELKVLGRLPLRRLEASKHRIQYRHIIDWLVRKPGAFENYRYREDLFPTHRFRMAYDELKRTSPCRAAKEYLGILYLAARKSEVLVDHILQALLDRGIPLSAAVVEQQLRAEEQPSRVTEIKIAGVELASYDALLSSAEVTT